MLARSITKKHLSSHPYNYYVRNEGVPDSGNLCTGAHDREGVSRTFLIMASTSAYL